ncbi:response regulator transcription factor [Desulfosporosinus sp. FKB]|uniref:response regulator n=1 Tax=Desulfosporosinus sp. FKB TaxID=1969835 RepID=UPI000B49D6DB|nr:response regulator transcription factor [Desulfosporosinus sp. FKB]
MPFNLEKLLKIKVLVVDDHTLFAEGTVSLLSSEPRISVVGIAKSGKECLSLISVSKPDVVLLDIKLPDASGTDLIDKIKKVQPVVKIIMLTGYSPKGYITKSMSRGADGFLLKDCAVQEMIQGILKVYNSGVYFSKGLEIFLPSENNCDRIHALAEIVELPGEKLTPKESEIIELVSRGLHNKDIAEVLGIKVATVNFHVSNILVKMNVKTRLEAVLKYKDGELSNL